MGGMHGERGVHGRSMHHKGGGGHVWWGYTWQGAVLEQDACMAGGTCGWGYTLQGAMCGSRMHAWRTVRILLECILVTNDFATLMGF